MQRMMLLRILEDNCETYNAALQERKEAWKLERKSVNYYDQQAELTDLRRDTRFQWMACDIMRDPLTRLDKAMKAFFRRLKVGEKPGFPRFKAAHSYDSFSFCNKLLVLSKSIRIPKFGYIRMRGGMAVVGRAKLCTIKRDGKRWTASIVCDIGPAPEKCVVSNPIGVDVGLKSFLTLSDGRSIDNPRFAKKAQDKIANKQRALELKQRGSGNRIKAIEALRRAYQSALNTRSNFIHHVSKWLVSNFDLIAFEKLNIKGMVEQKKYSKSIMDAAWGILDYQLIYKAEYAGKWAIPVDPRRTSIICSRCGEDVRKTLRDRQHVCACGENLDRDENAAKNILGLGMRLASGTPLTEQTVNPFCGLAV